MLAEQAQPASANIVNAAENRAGARSVEPALGQRRRSHVIQLVRPIALMTPPLPIGSGCTPKGPRHGRSLACRSRPTLLSRWASTSPLAEEPRRGAGRRSS